MAGNHDTAFDQQPEYARSLIPEGVQLIENDGFEFEGIQFYSVAARPYLDGPVALPKDIDFLITHDPAYGHLIRGEGDRDLYLAIAKGGPSTIFLAMSMRRG